MLNTDRRTLKLRRLLEQGAGAGAWEVEYPRMSEVMLVGDLHWLIVDPVATSLRRDVTISHFILRKAQQRSGSRAIWVQLKRSGSESRLLITPIPLDVCAPARTVEQRIACVRREDVRHKLVSHSRADQLFAGVPAE
jgi:hypothetical protein